MPTRVGPDVDGPRLALLVDRPALGEIGHQRASRSVADQTREEQRDEVAIRLRARGER